MKKHITILAMVAIGVGVIFVASSAHAEQVSTTVKPQTATTTATTDTTVAPSGSTTFKGEQTVSPMQIERLKKEMTEKPDAQMSPMRPELDKVEQLPTATPSPFGGWQLIRVEYNFHVFDPQRQPEVRVVGVMDYQGYDTVCSTVTPSPHEGEVRITDVNADGTPDICYCEKAMLGYSINQKGAATQAQFQQWFSDGVALASGYLSDLRAAATQGPFTNCNQFTYSASTYSFTPSPTGVVLSKSYKGIEVTVVVAGYGSVHDQIYNLIPYDALIAIWEQCG